MNETKMNTKRRVRHVQIHGSVVDLMLKDDKGVLKRISSRSKNRFFVSPEWVELYYLIVDGDFDQERYDRLSDRERRDLASIIRWLDVENRAFNIALSRSVRKQRERMAIIEGAIRIGNLSSQLVDEYCDIINELRDLGMLPKNSATSMVLAMKRTYAKQLASSTETAN